MKIKSILVLALLLLPTVFVVVGCASDNPGNSKVNDDVEINSPDNPKGKGLRKNAQGG